MVRCKDCYSIRKVTINTYIDPKVVCISKTLVTVFLLHIQMCNSDLAVWAKHLVYYD